MSGKIKSQAKITSSADPFKSAMTIVEAVAETLYVPDMVGLPKLELIARMINRHRQGNRPEDPKDMEFELAEQFLPPAFLRQEVRVDGKRHLIFATDHQLDLLKNSRRWYIDGTYKVLRKPFSVLVSIHVFVRRGGSAKQIPLVFVVMSGHTKKDYVKSIGRMLEGQVAVEGFVVDFEEAMWGTLKEVFEGATIHGCAFHWTQAVWRQVQKKGLATVNAERGFVHAFVGQLLCLPFLPSEHIEQTFEFLADLSADHQLTPLIDYVRRTWFQSSVWTPAQWSVFGQSIRTNNDVEGWHRRLSYKAGSKPLFYALIQILHQEASVARMQVTLVTELRLRRYQRSCYKSCQQQLLQLWEQYSDGNLTATGLLKAASVVYRPALSIPVE